MTDDELFNLKDIPDSRIKQALLNLLQRVAKLEEQANEKVV